MATVNPLVLSKFRAALNDLYGNRIERVVLYGSRARGDARPDSDYDIDIDALAARYADPAYRSKSMRDNGEAPSG